ncbi:MAG TPA: hypothetical protein VGV15_04975, partial [Terriglobales bacterium]|nr:hypothetical protein [Terriglobales bacterium]
MNNGFAAEWTDYTILSSYLPATGTDGTLSANLSDPTTTSAGSFGGSVVALKLNVDYNDAGVLSGGSTVKFGDLRVCG